jgi:tRNA(fMet)-specific endonuclease VapC
MFVLDTDILSLLLSGHAKVTERLYMVDDPHQIAVSLITRIEVLRGRFDSVMKAADADQLLIAQLRLERDEEMLGRLRVLGIDEDVAAEFTRLRPNKSLKKIGCGDLLIACTALAYDAIRVTRNRRHFSLIPGLQIENWAD